MTKAIAVFLAGLTWAAVANANPLIDVGDYALLPDMVDQQIALLVGGGDSIQGINLLVQLGDGGAALGGIDGSAPSIQDISITTGTIFAANNTGRVFDDAQTDQLWQIHTTTASGSVAASGVFALLTIDTTGFTSGTFSLRLADIGGDSNADTDFAGVPATIINGMIIVPEPGTLLLVPLSVVGLMTRFRRLRQS